MMDIECQTEGGETPRIKVELLNQKGDVLRGLDVPPLVDGRARLTLPVSALASSTYVLKIEAAVGERTAQQWVAFRTVR
jgi:hypothetical protein